MQDFSDNFKNIFINFEWYDALDIIIASFVIFFVLRILKKNNILKLTPLLFFLIVLGVIANSKWIAQKDNMYLFKQIFGNYVIIAIVCIFILFADTIKKALYKIGTKKSRAEIYDKDYQKSPQDIKQNISEIVNATLNMSKQSVGALIVVSPEKIENIISTGFKMDAKLSSDLLETIFTKDSKMSSGASFITGNKIVATACTLPLSKNENMQKSMGARHLAAVGLSEQSNVLCIVCSAKTGIISAIREGKIRRYCDANTLTDLLEQVYGLKAFDDNKIKLNTLQ